MESWNFWLGAALVIWWASRTFQSPYALGYVRDRTDSQRYVVGAAVFALGTWMAYVLIWILMMQIRARLDISAHVVGLSAVIATGIVLPRLPLVSTAVARFRRFAQNLAGFPDDVGNLAMGLRRPGVGRGDAAESFNAGIGQFGLSLLQLKKHLSSSSMASILEAQRMHDRLTQCRHGDTELGEPGFLGHYRGRHRQESLHRYLNRRQNTTARLDSDYFQLLHRAARVVKLADDQPLSPRQRKQLSAFLADQAEDLIARYQKLVAQTALAVFPPGPPRVGFLERMGYTLSHSMPSLPLWPIVAVLAVDVLTSGSGFVLITYISKVNGADLGGSVPVIFAHGFSMTAAVFWAIAPKVMWPWTRPGLTRGSIASYPVFGLVSYACSFVFFVAAVSGFVLPSAENTQDAMPTSATLLLPPGLFAVSNVVLSWRIDRRIVTSTYGYGGAAARDALSLITATILFSLFFRTMAHLVFGMPWKLLPAVWLIWPVLGITALVIGFAIPGWAVGYIYPLDGNPNSGSADRNKLLAGL